jgi:hypothetical protein
MLNSNYSLVPSVAGSLTEQKERWSHKAITALLEDNVYQLQMAFEMPGADLATKVVGYSRYGKYGRTNLSEFNQKLTHRAPGDTVLHLAVRNNKIYAVTKLLSLGCSPTAMNDVGESSLEIAKHLKESGKNPHMSPLFQGISIELPTGGHVIYESKYLKHIQEQIKSQKQAIEYNGMKRQLEEALTANVNHERAREFSESKLVIMRKDRERLDIDRGQAVTIRDEMQDKRNNAESARVSMAADLDQLRLVKQRLDEMERAKNAVEERYMQEVQSRQRFETERDEALVLARELRTQRNQAEQKVVGAGVRLKETVGACLSVSLAQLTEKTKLEGEVHSWIDKVSSKEKEIVNLRTINASALQAKEQARLKKSAGRIRAGSPLTSTSRSRQPGMTLVSEEAPVPLPIAGPE